MTQPYSLGHVITNTEDPRFDPEIPPPAQWPKFEHSRQWHRRFYLYRQVDDTGISGRGVVAHGVEFVDGTVVLRWLGDKPSTVVWPGIMEAMAVHGHGGHTVAVFLDDNPPPRAT